MDNIMDLFALLEQREQRELILAEGTSVECLDEEISTSIENNETVVKPEVCIGKVYTEKLQFENVAEVNILGINQQKREIKKYLLDNGISESFEERVLLRKDPYRNTLHHEGFYIEGYKIKYRPDKVFCYFGYEGLNYHTENKYISSKLKEIYLLLRDKFDVVPSIARITDSTNAPRNKEKPFKFDLKDCVFYNCIEYLEITKEKTTIDSTLELIDGVENRIKDYVVEYVKDVEYI